MRKLFVLILAAMLCLTACGEEKKPADRKKPAEGNEVSVNAENDKESAEFEFDINEETADDKEASAENTDGETKEESADEESKEDIPGVSELGDLTPYIRLGAWNGVNIAEKVELTDEIVEGVLQESYLAEHSSLAEKAGAAEMGDTVIIDYKGYFVDTGEAFEGGEDSDAELLLGSDKFVDGFESGIVGHSAGESFDIYLTFPEDYYEELANKQVRFAITLDKVQETVYPAIDAELAKKLGFDSVEALEAAVQADAEEQVYTQNLTNVWSAVLDDAEIVAYPEALYNEYVEYFEEYYISMYEYYATYYGMEMGEYLETAMGMTEEEFKADLHESAVQYANGALKEELTMYAVADVAFNREISESEYEAFLQKYAKDNDTTVEELKKTYTKEDLLQNMLWDKVMVYLYDNAVFGALTE